MQNHKKMPKFKKLLLSVFDCELCSRSPRNYFLLGVHFPELSSVVTRDHKGSFSSSLGVI